MTDIIDGPRHEPANGSKPLQLVVLLHGYGADGNDLIGLAPYFEQFLPNAYFVAPNAHEACAMSPSGYQWFPIGGFDEEERVRGVLSAEPIVNRFIDTELQKLDFDERNLILIGFSQGTMMSLHVGLRRHVAPAAIIGFSGMLVGAERLKDECNVKPPVLLIHGDQDELLPVANLFDASQGLGAAGINVEWHVSQGVGHGIGEDGLVRAKSFLQGLVNVADC